MTKEAVERAMTRAAEERLEATAKEALTLQSQANLHNVMGGGRHLVQLIDLSAKGFKEAVNDGVNSVFRFAPQEVDQYRDAVAKLVEELQTKFVGVFNDYGGTAKSFNRTSPREEGVLREKLMTLGMALLEEFDLEVGRRVGAPAKSVATNHYVDLMRLAELRSLPKTQYDFARLIAMCDELNIAAAGGALHAQAILVRAILDHVPPIFSQPSFNAVVSNYAGSRSFLEAMEHLNKGSRKIADAHLHTPIRAKETLPTPTQVDFRSLLDILLGEVVRISR